MGWAALRAVARRAAAAAAPTPLPPCRRLARLAAHLGALLGHSGRAQAAAPWPLPRHNFPQHDAE